MSGLPTGSLRSGRGVRAWLWLGGVLLVAAGSVAYYQWVRTSLSLTSDPAGAEVRIDGRLAGRTPLEQQALTPGLHRIELSHSHYVVHEQQIGLEAGEDVSLHIALRPGRGKLLVHSNPRGAWVEVDGVRQSGTAPLLLDLRSGPHEIALGMDERRAVAERVVVMANQTVEARLDLDIDPHGSLLVETVPADARVALPGADVEYQPGVRLPIGEHVVRVTRAGYVTREVRLDVRYGENRHALTLERQFAPLSVTTEPAGSRVRVAYRLLDDGPLVRREYRPGLRVPVGEVEVRASAMGRRSVYRRFDVDGAGAALSLTLEPMQVVAGTRFRDSLQEAGEGPEMVVLPAGQFVMGDDDGAPTERPARRIHLTEPFAVSVTEVTAGDYRRFAHATGRGLSQHLVEAPENMPATHLSFGDAAAYAEWLSQQSGERYRLLSEAEWEYMARGGSEDNDFGSDPDRLCAFANVADRSMRSRYRESYGTADCDDGFAELAPVGSFPANAFGVHDGLGNVAEWVLECGMPSYAGGPDDGSPLDDSAACPTHGVRGGSWDDAVSDVRAGKRNVASSPGADRGLRVMREL